MPIVPGRTLVLALLLPVLLAFAALAEPALVRTVLAVDGGLVLLALIDLAFVWRPRVTVTRHAPETLSLARPVAVELEVKNHARRRLVVSINDDVFPESRTEGLPITVEVGAGHVKRASYRLWAMARGVRTLGDHWVRYASPAGFWIRQLRLGQATELRVYPDVQAVRHYELLARQNRDFWASRLTKMRGGDTEFERLRDFLPDDELRRVDWKATARRRKLTAREYQLEKNQNVVFLVDCGRLMTAVWDELTALDYALNATLMLSHVAVRRGDLVGLIAFDEKVQRLVRPRGGLSASNQVIQATFDLFPRMVESDYDLAFRTLRTHVRRRTLVVFITHAIDDATAKRLKSLSRELLPQHLPLVVLLKDREVEARAHGNAFTPEELGAQAAAAEILLWKDRLITELTRAGVMVLDVLHHQLTGAVVSRYLEVKARGLI